MRCPFCGHDDTQVKDSRPSDDGSSIRRRRECSECGARFTTFERVQLREMTVVKNDGTKQPFERDKLVRSMTVALRKRPVNEDQIDKAVTSIVRQLESMGEAELQSQDIGELVMKALAHLDTVGYIRYASVYKDFNMPADFNQLLQEIENVKSNKTRRKASE